MSLSPTAAQINGMLASEGHLELVFGNVERNMFPSVSVHGHHTFRCGSDTYTTVDSTDSIPLCSEECLAVWAGTASYPKLVAADVLHEHEVWTVPHYVDPVTLRSAVAHPFTPSSDTNYNVLCEVCGSLMFTGSPITVRYLADAFRSYLVAALWSSLIDDTDDDMTPADERFTADDIDEDTAAELLGDLIRFYAENFADVRHINPEQFGHDLWLTQNRHGAGFWDRGLGEVGERLTEAAHALGEQFFYVDVNGNLAI